MRKEDLFSAIGGIDDRFIAEADEVKVKAPGFNLKRIGAIAACFVIALAVVIGAANLGMNMGGESMMPEMPGIDKGDDSIEGENESIGGAELFERVENEAGYLVLEKLDGRAITLRIKLNDKEAFGIIYLEQYGEEKRYTAFNISAPAQEGYSESDAKIRLTKNGADTDIVEGEETVIQIILPTLIDGNPEVGEVRLVLGSRIIRI